MSVCPMSVLESFKPHGWPPYAWTVTELCIMDMELERNQYKTQRDSHAAIAVHP